jgi:hypothetical protein
MRQFMGMYWRSNPLKSGCCHAASCNTDRESKSGCPRSDHNVLVILKRGAMLIILTHINAGVITI